MDTDIRISLRRLEDKVDKVFDKLDAYSLECSKDRVVLDVRLNAIEAGNIERKTKEEDNKKMWKNHLWLIAEKALMYIVATYFLGKEVLAHF